MILNGILFLLCVVLFQLACVSLLFGLFPLFVMFIFLFGVCYSTIRYSGPSPKQIHLTYFNGDGGDEDEEEYIPPFNRNNFKMN